MVSPHLTVWRRLLSKVYFPLASSLYCNKSPQTQWLKKHKHILCWGSELSPRSLGDTRCQQDRSSSWESVSSHFLASRDYLHFVLSPFLCHSDLWFCHHVAFSGFESHTSSFFIQAQYHTSSPRSSRITPHLKSLSPVLPAEFPLPCNLAVTCKGPLSKWFVLVHKWSSIPSVLLFLQ